MTTTQDIDKLQIDNAVQAERIENICQDIIEIKATLSSRERTINNKLFTIIKFLLVALLGGGAASGVQILLQDNQPQQIQVEGER